MVGVQLQLAAEPESVIKAAELILEVERIPGGGEGGGYSVTLGEPESQFSGGT